MDNIKSGLDTVNGFQLAVENSLNNEFLYCTILGLYMANWNLVRGAVGLLFFFFFFFLIRLYTYAYYYLLLLLLLNEYMSMHSEIPSER